MSIAIATYSDEHFDDVDLLWREAFPNDSPWNSAETAIPAKTAFQPDLFVVALDGARVVGSVLAGYDGYRGWLERVAVRRSHHRQQVGTMLVREAERRMQALGCIKINLQVRTPNAVAAGFYHRLGYMV